jgi:DNA-binding response OmpR family regulator
VWHERGLRTEATAALQSCLAGFVPCGLPAAAAWCRRQLARCLLVAGRRRDAWQLLADARDADEAGADAAWLERDDPVTALRVDEPVPLLGHRGAWTRAHAVSAVRAAMRGDANQAAVRIAEVERHAHGPGYALDRVLAHLARAALLAIDGSAPAANTELLLARGTAVEGPVDADLVTELVCALGDIVVVTGADRRLASSSSLELPADAVIADARSHGLTVGGQLRSLVRFPIRRRLLYALALHPGRVLDKEQLVEAVWGHPYDPLRHDDTIKSNIFYLRRSLVGSGVAIVCGHPGYRLEADARFAFVFALDLISGAAAPAA